MQSWKTNKFDVPKAAQPFLTTVTDPNTLARIDFHEACELNLNDLLNQDLMMATGFLAASAYFGRDSVSLPGLSKIFDDEASSLFCDAQALKDYICLRGGRVRIVQNIEPCSDFSNTEKGDALHGLETALACAKLR